MSVKIVTETTEKEVSMMTDPTAEFVSLVKHGANRMPFRVVKSQQRGGEDKAMLVVQSILLPKSAKLEDVAKLKGNEWLSDARVEKSQEFEDYIKLVQSEASKFDGKTMRMLQLPGGALALVGNLSDGVDPNGMLTISEEVTKANLIDTPMDATVATVTEEAQPYSYDISFGDLLWREMDSLSSIIFGALKQASSDPKKRKSTILNAIDAFRSFMSMGLDNTSGEAMKIDKPASGKTKTEGENTMFKDKEEFVAAVGAVVDERLTAMKTEAEKKAAANPDEKDKKKDDEVVVDNSINIAAMIGAAIDKALAPLAEKLETVAIKTETISAQLTTDPASTTAEDEDKAKKEEKEEEDGKDGVFSGLLSGKAMDRSGFRRAVFGA